MQPAAGVTIPPYNSYDDYSVTVCASHYLHGHRKQSSEQTVYLEVQVVVRYLSSNKSIKRNFKGHHTFKNFKCPVHMLTSVDPSLSFEIISFMTDLMNIPFSLDEDKDRFHWIEEDQSHNGLYCPNTTTLTGADDMVEHILDYARRCITCMNANYTPQAVGMGVGVEVRIEKSVILPHLEFEAWITWAETFEKEYSEVITGRPLRELEDQYLKFRELAVNVELNFTPAARSSIEALEKGAFEEGGGCSDDDHKLCSICMEAFLIGSQVTRMPCSHLYHEDCILSWLKKNDNCPNCRFKLVSKLDILHLLGL